MKAEVRTEEVFTIAARGVEEETRIFPPSQLDSMWMRQYSSLEVWKSGILLLEAAVVAGAEEEEGVVQER